ncbi:MMPL family transporter [Streptomyces hainanensis]|uniref:MMPL family transporter n=1 Tax=Streptomyces hainanensis TaxID=402648 RepID=A0A4R4TAV1_9ACTN|nr:MMPL family transporter [Streptomyces hainanensis]TDC72272.1 MMPL family transporter [Streptomyces hainanensis]
MSHTQAAASKAPHPHPPADRPTRLGRFVKRAKWPVLLGWLLLAVAAGGLAADLGDVQRDDAAAYLPSGYESSRVAELAEPDPEHPDAETALVLHTRDDGAPLDDADLAAVRAAAAAVSAADVPGATPPGDVDVAEDGRTTLFPVRIQPAHADDDTVERAVAALRDTVAEAPTGLTARVTGEAALGVDNSGGDVDAALMLTSMAIVAVLLLGTYRSPVLWLVPLLAALVAVVASRAAAYGLAQAGLTVSELSSAIQIVLVFGAGTDYALLYLSRYREELARHHDRHEAVAEALRRTGPAILASAGTVTAGLLCLLVADLAGLRGLGPVAAAGIVISLVAMLTLLPALLACAGRWPLWPRAPRPGRPRGAADHRLWDAVARRVVARPRRAGLLVTLGLCLATLGLTGLTTSADPIDKVPPDADSVIGRETLAEHFPEGLTAPLTVVLPADADAATLAAAEGAAAGARDVAAAAPGEELAGRPTLDVELAVPPYGDRAGDAIRAVRAALADVTDDALVGGTPAVQLDYREAALDDTARIVPLVLLAIAVILAALLRSLVAPVLLLAATVLSFAASLGLSTLVFTEVMGFGGVAADLFVYVFVFLVALGVDYTIFLMERVREERRHHPTPEAVRRGLAATGGVITAAGLVLAGTFAALAQIPDVTVAEVGVGVAIGVLVETLLVRSVQVPAAVVLLGDRVWWPSRRRG